MMDLVIEYWAVFIVCLMVLAALIDPRPRHDKTRRSKRDRKRVWWR